MPTHWTAASQKQFMSEGWSYSPASDLNKSWSERLKGFPREPDMIMYGLRAAGALLMRAWLRGYHRFTVRGLENLPKESSFVLVCNHSSHLDALSLQAALPLNKLHRTFPAAAADYFFTTIPRMALSAIFVNALPFSRQAHAMESLSLCKALLQSAGNVLILFPEGTRTATGQMSAFKPGIGLLLAGMNVPVVPCFLKGAYAAWPKGSLLPKPKTLELNIGSPRSYEMLPPGKASALQIAADLHQAVTALSV